MSRILLVEDNEDNFDMVCFLLERAGFEVLGAHDGQEGIDVACREHPDLILMDLSLPEVDGWTAASILKADPTTKNIMLLALTAHALPGDRKRAMDIGFDGYITKPINVLSFADSITEVLRTKKKSKGE